MKNDKEILSNLTKEQKKELQKLIQGKEEVISFLTDIYKKMFFEQLNLIEDVLTITADIPNGKKLYEKIRARILRIGNDAIRDSKKFLEQYNITRKQIKITDQIDFG